MASENYLISHWSFSAINAFLANRYKFFLTYVLKVWKFRTGPSALVGKAGHIAIEAFLKGASVESAIALGAATIHNVKPDEINWGKTGSLEDALKKYSFAINEMFAGMPKIHKIISIEESLTEFVVPIPEIKQDAVEFPIPLKGKIDMLHEAQNGDFEIWDWKYVESFTKSEEEKPPRIMQAICYYQIARAKYNRIPKRCRFVECKTTKNKDGSPQVQEWILDFDVLIQTQPEYFVSFYRIYDLISTEISKEDVTFLPNISDFQDGEETFKLFAGESFGVDRPAVVKHKMEEVELVEKRYVPSASDKTDNRDLTAEEKIRLKFQEFGVAVDMKDTITGHSIILYTFKPSRGVRMKDFEKYEKDIAIALKSESVRIEAPIMGTDLVGVEVPNPNRTFVTLPSEVDPNDVGTLNIPIGIDVYGSTVKKSLSDMPHLLVAGATGSGKSVFLNVLIKSICAQTTPEQMRMILIDPKRVELAGFRDDPHVMARPIYEMAEALKTLRWCVDEMERRYEKLESAGMRNIEEYNANTDGMCRIVVVIDEFADLMLQTKEQKGKGEPNLTETAIVRIAQKARAVGIHLVLGTQRPSVDVVTGLIKANIPTRVAFATSQKVDSQIILDQAGAEALIGKGDLLFLDPSERELQRLQSYYA